MRKALLAGLLLASLSSARDFHVHPVVVETDTPSDIFAIGDAHADYVRLTTVIRAAGIIDSADHWNAGKAVLVITGDMIDKGPRALGVLRLIMALQTDANRAGGRVVALAGNHEAEFLADPAAPKVVDFATELRAAGMQPAEVAACNGEIGEFLCGLPFAARVNSWYFSHAGNTRGRTLRQIESDVESDFAKHGFAAQQLIGDYSILEARLNGAGKGREPWVDTGLPAVSEQELLQTYARALGVAHIVEGHVPGEIRFSDGVTRKAGEMFQLYGLLFLIDTGMSQGVNESLGAVLRISGETAVVVHPDGQKTPLWANTTRQ